MTNKVEIMMNRFLRITLILAGFVLLIPQTGSADTPLPVINEPEGEGVKCVEPEEVMVREHMNFILHQRDETMHRGIRTSKYSLAECIDCHVQPDDSGKIARIDSEEHFCNGCHEYAGVTIDCFECHADRPQKFIDRGNGSASLQDQLNHMLSASEDMGGELK
ncbi:MAG: sulfur reduction protein DsrJ [Gammaproteobacteria bacterium]|nr:sulfur reduction protein DsrJ [Gammaproteobacteria bacterium]